MFIELLTTLITDGDVGGTYTMMCTVSVLTPSRSSNDVKAFRMPDRSSIYVLWNYATFDEVGAFFIYKVSATPITTSRHHQSGTPIEKLVLYNETSTIVRVDTNVDYYVTVSYVLCNTNSENIDSATSGLITHGIILNDYAI